MSLTRQIGVCSAAILSLSMLAGCAHTPRSEQAGEPAGTINILISLEEQSSYKQGILEEQSELTKQIVDNFKDLYPKVDILIEQIRERDLTKQLSERLRDGLSPDLILVSGRSAQELDRMKLTMPVPMSWVDTKQINPALLQRLSLGRHHIMGVPVFLVPQIACYNRKHLSKSPTNLNTLMQLSNQGLEVGFALDMYDLFWTIEAWGGKAAVDAAPGGQALTVAQKQGILRWLQALLRANLQLTVNFYNQQEELIQGLLNKRLDWITCRSTSLGRLRKQLGEDLGVAALPDGPTGAASPRTISKAWVFGRDSSPNQRAIAKKFTSFSINYVMQRYIALSSKQMLPVHQKVSIPIGNSPELQAMVKSEQQAQRDNPIRRLKPSDERLKRLSRLITQMIYGERSPEQTQVDVINLIQEKSWNKSGE